MKSKKNVENLPAGPEINALIAEEIFGAIPLSDDEWDLFKAAVLADHGRIIDPKQSRVIKIPLSEPEYNSGLMFRFEYPRDYSSESFGSSRLVVEKMRQDGWKFRQADGEVHDDNLAAFWKGDISGHGRADTDALAICRAALAAVREYRRLIANK